MKRVLFYILLLSFAACQDKSSRNTEAVKDFVMTAPVLDSASLISDLAYLSSGALEGRETGSKGNRLAREYIVKRCDSLKLTAFNAGWLQEFTFKQDISYQGINVIAAVAGTAYPGKYLVISAHYDHLGIRNGDIYYGADDNASGAACLLALARYFREHRPRHSFIFAFFDAEEKGLAGSTWFLQYPPVTRNKIMLDVNMDMISRNDKNEIYVSGTHWTPFLKKYVDSVRSHTLINVLFGHDNPAREQDDWTGQSDHYPFHKAAIPFLYFGVEDHPDYHKPSDTFDKINKTFYYRVCDMIREVIVEVDRNLS